MGPAGLGDAKCGGASQLGPLEGEAELSLHCAVFSLLLAKFISFIKW